MFDKYRPKDINLEIPIYSKEVELTYYQFNDSALNGFSRELSEQRDKLNHYRIIKTTKLKTKTLKDILDHHLPIGKQIDLLSIDVEGLDMEVLKSNDWSKYLPTIILVEDKEFDFESPEESEIYSYLSQKKYKLVGKTLNTLILILKDNWIGI